MPRKRSASAAPQTNGNGHDASEHESQGRVRSFWTGSISFGLVNIPVKLTMAVRQQNVYFHLLHEKDSVRLKQRLVCPADDQEVPRTEAVKGYELNSQQMVVLEPEELAALAPKARRTIELLDFVALSDIDSMYFDHPYYLVPDKNAGKAYRLFHEALAQSKRVGIGTFVMRNRQYLAAIRALENVLCLETMYYADELVPPPQKLPTGSTDPRELAMAKQLIDALSRKFKPEKYHDEYRDAVLKLIEQKSKGHTVTAEPVLPQKRADVSDILSALEASLRDATHAPGGNGNGHGHGNGHGTGHGQSRKPRKAPHAARRRAHRQR